MTRVETKAFMALSINDAAIHGSAVRVHIEDGKKYSDPPCPRVQHFGFFDLDDICNCAVSRGQNGIGICGSDAFRIAKK